MDHGPTAARKFRNLTMQEMESDPIAVLANQHFGQTKKVKFDAKFVNDIIDSHLAPSQYNPRQIMLLEYTQYLEKYLWPFFDPAKASFQHVLSICLMVNEKYRQRVSPWDTITDDAEKFDALFRHVLQSLTLSNSLDVQRALLLFLIHSFQSFENASVRAECLKLVSIGIWKNLCCDNVRENLMGEYPTLRKLWNSANKKYEAADKDGKAVMDQCQSWLSNAMTDVIQKIYQIEQMVDTDLVMYCERFVEFLIDLEAQLPTRRFFNTLLNDYQFLTLCRLSPLMQRDDQDVRLLKQLIDTLSFYAKFEINDQTGQALSDLEMTEQHSQQLIHLQHTVFSHFRDVFPELPLSNLGSIESRSDLLWHLDPASEDNLVHLCEKLNLRTTPIVPELIGQAFDRKTYLLETIIDKYQKRTSQIEQINKTSLYPDEATLFSDSLIQSQYYTGERPLAIPKLNLQFLTLHDYLLRNYNLFRLESYYEIRQDVEDAVKRLGPRLTYPERTIEWSGWARMALPINAFSVVDVARPDLGKSAPSRVVGEVNFSVDSYTKVLRDEWDSLRRHDIVFLLTIRPHDNSALPFKEGDDFLKHYGIKYIRGAEVIDVLDQHGRPIHEAESKQLNPKQPRQLQLALDPNQYTVDADHNHHGGEDVYETFNVLLRRKPQENNFKAVLETIRDLMQSDLVVPDWLQKVFLGYGDPASANYKQLPNSLPTLDFRDTFLDWSHLKDSFVDKTVDTEGAEESTMVPPFKITTVLPEAAEKPKKKKSKKAMDVDVQETLCVSSYKAPNKGPYPQDIPKLNAVRFTPVQVEAIHSGLNHGLTMVVGPPGTGKTDVAVQTIANLYHNHPSQHTLIVTHSNQALNQIFEKLMALDIDPRHLVRLGHGQEELNTDVSFSKFGRVSSFLELRVELLNEVDRLAKSLQIFGDHGASCETAGYFYRSHVLTRWTPYENMLANPDTLTMDELRDKFPFTLFFSNAPQPWIQEDSLDESIEAARGCFRHLQSMFDTLEEIRPFELLRYQGDRANYLITKEAKIIAMTCTHAALKRRELVDLKFKYDNVVMEESAQILEVETFIPMLLQEPEDGQNRLKRVILIGDHHQLPPVVKNQAFQQYGNMEQSLFSRFVRLGVPALQLDAQGRARPSLAKLYSWQYGSLGDLPNVQTEPAFQLANPGLTYDYQFIHVDAYHGQGESEPVPFFYQNLGEAEYIVALYQYMRLMGYPAEKISILTTYNGQRSLINDVLQKRCGWNAFFGRPAAVTTVDRYQGQQNDYILLSLVRTKSVGHLRDVRRLIVAMSRARLGLYIFGSERLFANCYELKPVFDQLLARPSKLSLHLDESMTTSRKVDDHKKATAIDNVEDLGSLVYKMSEKQLDLQREEQAQAEAEALLLQQQTDEENPEDQLQDQEMENAEDA
ncbi:P-loop containing nucleoside triphosphate hydrolase protein [Hesseltinella vesiculosa]|uniref:Pre-mRNA-splicing factor n=1 Tax=Hesseltinella vesiculosa TaxID=101127 RepID=A0A1X2GEQ3_9FUNG|nr:P-loop containing nucleoside triphosphate hydrolase protein [Hesseltinella vesiculosa]